MSGGSVGCELVAGGSVAATFSSKSSNEFISAGTDSFCKLKTVPTISDLPISTADTPTDDESHLVRFPPSQFHGKLGLIQQRL